MFNPLISCILELDMSFHLAILSESSQLAEWGACAPVAYRIRSLQKSRYLETRDLIRVRR